MTKDSVELQLMKEIEKLISPEVTWIDALVEYARINDIEIEVLADMAKRNHIMKAHIQNDAEDLNLLERTSRLPI